MAKKTCEYCGEEDAIFSIEVICTDGSLQSSELICPKCIANWYTETPEDVRTMLVKRLEAV